MASSRNGSFGQRYGGNDSFGLSSMQSGFGGPLNGSHPNGPPPNGGPGFGRSLPNGSFDGLPSGGPFGGNFTGFVSGGMTLLNDTLLENGSMEVPLDYGSPPSGSGPMDVSVTISEGMRIFGASTYLVLVLFSLVSNFVLMLVFVKGHKQFKSMAFFIIAWQMLICDFMGDIVYLILHVPLTFSGESLYGNTFPKIIGVLATLSFNGAFFFVFLLTINRFMVFIFPKANNVLFTTPRIYVLIAFVWLLACGLTAGNILTGCMQTFDMTEYHLAVECSQIQASLTALFGGIESTMAMYIPIAMMVVYVFLFIEIRFRVIELGTNCRRPSSINKTNRKEILILIQSVLLCGIFELENVIVSIIPSVKQNASSNNTLIIVLCFCQSWIFMLTNTMHSIVIFFFNSLAREVFYVMIGKKKQISQQNTRATVIQVKPVMQRSKSAP